jgi:hypothetical protein
VRALIFRVVAENPTWGAPRMHGDLLKLGFDLSDRSVSRWVRRALRDPDLAKRWLTFSGIIVRPLLRWTSLPSQRSRLVFCIAFFVIGHDRRKILHFNVTRNPNASGLCSNCEKRGPTTSHTDSCYSTETQSLEPMWFRR